MQQEDRSNPSEPGYDLANVIKALDPLFRNMFPNVRRAVRRLTGDVSDAALDALVARLQRYCTHQQLETINEVAKTSGLPSLIAENLTSPVFLTHRVAPEVSGSDWISGSS